MNPVPSVWPQSGAGISEKCGPGIGSCGARYGKAFCSVSYLAEQIGGLRVEVLLTDGIFKSQAKVTEWARLSFSWYYVPIIWINQFFTLTMDSFTAAKPTSLVNVAPCLMAGMPWFRVSGFHWVEGETSWAPWKPVWNRHWLVHKAHDFTSLVLNFGWVLFLDIKWRVKYSF